MVLQEGDLTLALSEHLVGDCGVDSSSVSISRAAPSVVQGLRHCHQLGEVRPRPTSKAQYLGMLIDTI